MIKGSGDSPKWVLSYTTIERQEIRKRWIASCFPASRSPRCGYSMTSWQH